MKSNGLGGIKHEKLKAILFLFILLLGLAFTKRLLRSQKATPWLSEDVPTQIVVDLLKQETKETIYPFNPNFISDYRGYIIELTPAQIDRIHAFRAEGKWINSIAQFQAIAQVDAKWIEKYRPYFSFPKRESTPKPKNRFSTPKIININAASAAHFQAIRGIGPVLSERIVKYRKRLGGFSTLDQLLEVYGLSPEVVQRLQKNAQLGAVPKIERLSINDASLQELSALPYLNWKEAKQIVAFRTQQQKMVFNDLKKYAILDSLKIERLALYLY